jgi:Flp pilus assembly protein TadD
LLAAVEREPNRFDAYTRLGQLYASQGRLPDAVKQFETILSRNPKAVGSHTTLGVLLQMSGRLTEAERAYENTLAVDPRAGVAANNLAWLLVESQRDLDRALGLAQVASASMPDVAAVSDTLGWIYYRKDLPALALPPLLKAVKAEPRNPEFHYHLGAAYAAAGEKVKARQSLTQALELKLGANEAKHARALLESLRS